MAVLPGFSIKFNIQEAMKTGFTKFSGVGTLQEVSSLVSGKKQQQKWLFYHYGHKQKCKNK